MSVKRSESRSYMAYGTALAHCSHRKAHAHLLDYISENEINFDIDERAEAAILLGESYRALGDTGLACFFAKLGFDSARNHPIVAILYAKFLAKKVNRVDLALDICLDMVARLEDITFRTENGDYSRHEYINILKSLIEELSSLR